ncbi:MAG: NAD-dependent dihydropyrimidine dehydrogenase subunit PreA [Deltaproteobacteria bacterium]|nr:NAD-dependent dihydropyrimidine dehydrogenase subunit PreA [Deltaproteobacteria bacterium]
MKIVKEADLSVDFCGLKFQNPFVLSSAPPATTGEMIKRAFDAGWAGAVTKTLVREEIVNVKPRLASLAYPGSPEEPKKIYALENIELVSDRPLDVWLKEIEEIRKSHPDHVIIASLMDDASHPEGWKEMARRVEDAGAGMIELNMSCPHGMPEKGMGSAIGQDAELAGRVTRWVTEAVKIPVMAKMTPNVTDISLPARACMENGASAISAINTVGAIIGVDLETFVPKPAVAGFSSHGGLSGRAIKPIALKAVATIREAVDLPISGIGGIATWEDAAEFLLMGASTLQLCTEVMVRGYGIIDDLKDGLSNYMEDHGFASIGGMVGLALKKVRALSDLSTEYKVVSSVDEGKCVKCDICYVSCRDAGYQAISLREDRIPVVDEEKCTGCSLCYQVCPVWDCVTMKEVTAG